MRHFLLVCLIALLGTSAYAKEPAPFTGKDLYQSCTEGADNRDCTAYVHGFVDGMIMGYTAHGTSRKYCPPATGISVAQGRSIIEKWLRDHPERLKTNAGILAGLALSEAFPCRTGSN